MHWRVRVESVSDEGRAVEHRFPAAWAQPLLVPGYRHVIGPVLAEGRLTRSASSFLFQGSLHARVAFDCVRCARPGELELSAGATHLFVRRPVGADVRREPDEAQVWWFDEDTVDIEPAMAEEFVLMLPAYPLCSADCKGCCATCGQNLNEGTCQCGPDLSSPWASLAALREALKTGG